jgi:toxin ParE1/3/4
MLTIHYNRAAKKELFDSSFYYSKQAPGLGAQFLHEVEVFTSRIALSPNRWPRYSKDVRRCVMSRFPFGIYYRVDGEKIRILAIAHSSRYPAYWKLRK